jgi:hypothetical protein
VLLDPLKSLPLVKETNVGLHMGTIIEKAVDTNAIVDGNNDHLQVASDDELGSVRIGIGV